LRCPVRRPAPERAIGRPGGVRADARGVIGVRAAIVRDVADRDPVHVIMELARIAGAGALRQQSVSGGFEKRPQAINWQLIFLAGMNERS